MPVFLLTCAGPEESCAGTDWHGAPPAVFLSPAPASQPISTRIRAGCLTLLQRGLDTGAPHFLCIEDDVRFCRHLRENLATWPPWVRGEIHLTLLYHFGQRALARFPGGHFIHADPADCLGSQARIFSRGAAAHIIEKIDRESPLHQDEQMARLASALGPCTSTSRH